MTVFQEYERVDRNSRDNSTVTCQTHYLMPWGQVGWISLYFIKRDSFSSSQEEADDVSFLKSTSRILNDKTLDDLSLLWLTFPLESLVGKKKQDGFPNKSLCHDVECTYPIQPSLLKRPLDDVEAGEEALIRVFLLSSNCHYLPFISCTPDRE